jgi:cytochrome c oxidase subunit 3
MATVAVQEYRRNRIHPKKFALWVACASMGMLFAALTSAYMVRQAAGNWLEFPLPSIFFVSTAAILLSSGTLHGAYLAYKGERPRLFKGLLLLSLILGMAFLVLQYNGWAALKEMGIPLRLNPSGDFVYAISWIHAAHVVGGLAALIVTVIAAFARPVRVTPARKLRLELTLTYWHFVDLLWVYLIVFWTLQS